MKPTIKYALNGEYHYATVKDIGDIEKLKTEVKDDLVGAINSLIGNIGGGVPDDLQEILDRLESELDEISGSGFNDKELQELQDRIDELQDGFVKEIEEEIKKLEKEYDDKLDSLTSEYDDKVKDINSNLEDVKTNLDRTEESLEDVGRELSKVELNVLDIDREIDDINGVLKSKIDSTSFELLESKVSENSTSIEQNKESIEAKASQKDLDLTTGRVSDAEAAIKVNADGLSTTVKKDELRKELDELAVFAPNLLRNTRDWEGWTANSPSRAYLTSETYNHLHVQEQEGSGNYMEITVTDLDVGSTYSASIWARSSSSSAKAILRVNSDEYEMVNHNDDVLLSDSWERVSTTFVADSDSVKIAFTIKGVGNSVTSKFAGAKLEVGSSHSAWNANEEDVYERVVSAQSDIKQHADQIMSVVEKQTKIGEDVEENKTEINQLSDSIELHAEKIEEVDGEVKSAQADIKLNADNISMKVEQSDIDSSIDGISLDSRNLVLNSDFILDMEDWSNVNDGFKIKKVGDKNHLEISRSGLSSDMVASASSNMFPAKAGDRLSIGLDVTVDSLSKLDKKIVFVLDMFDEKDTRVDYKEFSIDELDGELFSGVTGRLTTRHSISREDVAKARIRLTLYRNGKIAFTNVSVEKGDIKSVGWNPAPEDSQMIQAKMQTSINQNAKDISLKAESSVVDKLSGDLKDNQSELKIASDKIQANVTEISKMGEEISEQGTKIEANTEAISLKAESSVVDKLGKDVESNKAELKIASDKIQANIESISKNENKLSDHSAKIEANAKEIKTKVTSVEVDSILETKKYATQSELNQKATEINATVSSIEKGVSDVVLTDKTELLSGNPIYTDKADDESVVHVEIDGKTVHQVPVGEGRNLLEGNWDATWEDSNSSYKYLLRPDIRSIAPKVKIGDVLTFSFSIEVEGTTDIKVYDNNGHPNIKFGEHTFKDLTRGKHELSFTKSLTEGDKSGEIWYFDIYNFNNNVKFSVWDIKIEKGDTATPYTPAPEDVKNNIQSVNSLDIISQKATVNGESAIDGIEVGGRNYALDSSNLDRKWSTHQGSSVTYEKVDMTQEWGFEEAYRIKTSGGYNEIKAVWNSKGHTSLHMEFDSEYTYSLYIKNMSDKSMTMVMNGLQGAGNINIPVGFNGRFIATGVRRVNYDWFQAILRASNDIDIIVGRKKVEKGTKATDWSPAPEDIPYDEETNGVYKTNISLDEPLRSVGDVKDRLFRDEDGLWKVERNLEEIKINHDTDFTVTTTGFDSVVRVNVPHDSNVEGYPKNAILSHFERLADYNLDEEHGYISSTNVYLFINRNKLSSSDVDGVKDYFEEQPMSIIFEIAETNTETLSQDLQYKLNNIPSFKDGNSVYTLDKSDLLLTPELHATFKSKGWYRNFQVNDGLSNKAEQEYVEDEVTSLQSQLKLTDEEIRMTVDENYLKKEEFSSFEESVSTQFTQTSEDFNFEFNKIVEQVTELDGETQKQFEEFVKYIRFVDGTIVLGEVGHGTTLHIQNNRISFRQEGNEVAYISDGMFRINRGVFVEDLTVNEHKLVGRGNGRTIIEFVGKG